MQRDVSTLRIEPDSLIEALAEVRFVCADLLDIVPAKLSQFPLADDFHAQRLPHADMPLPVRQMDPTLAVMPILQKVSQDGSRIAKFGEQVFSWHAVGKYPGWSVFQPELCRSLAFLFSAVKNVSITRVGLRYINAFKPDVHYISGLNDLALQINIAGKALRDEFNLNYSTSGLGMGATVKIATPSFVQGAQPGFSLVMDIDVYTPPGFYSDSANQVISWLDKAHLYLKTEFYSVLPDNILEKLRVR